MALLMAGGGGLCGGEGNFCFFRVSSVFRLQAAVNRRPRPRGRERSGVKATAAAGRQISGISAPTNVSRRTFLQRAFVLLRRNTNFPPARPL